MTPEQQQSAIAEATGWTFNPPPYNKPPFSAEFKAEALRCWVRPGNMSHQLEAPPNYPGSLDAMHEAEKVLKADNRKWRTYLGILGKLCGVTSILCDGDYYPDFSVAVDATAAQRAEAFLRTLNLWTTT